MGAADSWSATRARTFQQCRRKFYYRYVLAPLARKPEPSPAALQADRIKDLIGLEAWAGSVVHEAIEMVLNRWRARRTVSEDEALEHAARLLRRQFRDSQAFWSAAPDEFRYRPPLLDLHYYREGSVSRERAAELREMVQCSVRSFMRSEVAARCRAVGPSGWLPIERNAAVRVDPELLVLVKPDFAFRDGETLHILDWKTGRPDPFWEAVQVTCYALYAAEKWRHPPDRIVPHLVYLYPEFCASETVCTPETMREARLFIRETRADMAALLEPDGTETPPDPERFPLAEDPDRCRWCQFREMCDGAARCR